MEIGFVQNDHGLGAAFPCDGEIAFDAAQVEILIESGDEQHRVDVRREDLLRAGATHGSTRKLGAPRQHRMDISACFAGPNPHDDPIAHRREIRAANGIMQQLAGAGGGKFTESRKEDVRVLVLERDPRRHETEI